MKRRTAVEPIIRHVKSDHRMDRNYMKGHEGHRMTAVLAAAGYSWLERLLRSLLPALNQSAKPA